MNAVLTYLLNASIGIALFYSVFWLFLRNETFHRLNRSFLFLSLLLAVILPLFPLHYNVFVENTEQTSVPQTIPDTFQNIPIFNGNEEAGFTWNWEYALLLIYMTGASIFFLRLLVQTFIIVGIVIKYHIKTINGQHIVENEKYGLPFSFFNIVFINPKFHTQEELPEILAHENVHIREKHWFDLLFIELLTVIFWFNPFIWFFERSIKQNHEYLADKGVLAQGHNIGKYQALLLNQLMGMQIIGITNNLNFALGTNRLKMMTKKKTSRLGGIKFVWALPVVALLLFAFAEPNYQVKNIDDEVIVDRLVSNEAGNELTIQGKVINEKTEKPLCDATVLVKGTTIGTVTDENGEFTLVDTNAEIDENGNLKTTVVASYIGMKLTQMKVSSSNDKMKCTFLMGEDIVFIKRAVNREEWTILPPHPPHPVLADFKRATSDLKAENKEVFYIVESMPKYPEGFKALNDYVFEKENALKNDISGKANVLFTVLASGRVSDIKILKHDNEEVAKAAYKIVKEMPDWTPGKQRGKPVPVKYLLPVEF
jgi:hypothetical protein